MAHLKICYVVVLASLLCLSLSSASAQLNLSSTNVNPGDTIEFNGIVERCGGESSCELKADLQYFIRDLTGIYIQPINLNKTEINLPKSKTDVSGSFKIPETWPSGIYEFYVDHSYADGKLRPDGEGIEFNVSSTGSVINTDTWLYKRSDDSDFQSGTNPFINHYQYGNQDGIDWRTSSITLKKEIYLPEPQMIRFKVDIETNLECNINGNTIFYKTGYSRDPDCSSNSPGSRRASYKVDGQTYTVFCEDQMSYGTIEDYELLNLQKGWNNITCIGTISNDVYRRCVYWRRR